MIEGYGPQMNFNQGGIGETSQVAAPGFFKIGTFRFAYDAGELNTTDTPYAFCLKSNGTGYIVISPELRAMPCNRVGGYDKSVVVFIPGIETGGAPRNIVTDSGYAQQMMMPKQALNTLVKFYSFQR